jgi:hypothetical protein
LVFGAFSGFCGKASFNIIIEYTHWRYVWRFISWEAIIWEAFD